MKKIWIIIAIIVVAAVAGIIWYNHDTGKTKGVSDSTTENQSSNTQTASYFDDNAKVMYFYSAGCHYCVQQKAALESLASLGYKVKSMDVGAHPDYWEKYNIEGTPTFVAENGTKLVGLQTKEKLQQFLDENGK